MAYFQKKLKGVTLIEILLVLVIISSVLIGFVQFTQQASIQSRRDRAAMQMQQTLNAGMAYYVNYGVWPPCTAANGCRLLPDSYNLMQAQGYLPNIHILSPWGGDISYSHPSVTQIPFSVCITIPASPVASTTAAAIAAKLPNGFTTSVTGTECLLEEFKSNVNDCASGDACTVVGTVSIPGQNLNNARSINFASVYSSGGCVPAPSCPIGMQPQIFAVPASVRGLYTGGTDTKVYPISMFAVLAIGGTGTSANLPVILPGACNGGTPSSCVGSDSPTPNQLYWRVCLQVSTEPGRILPSNMSAWTGSIVAFTRCVPLNEPYGSRFNFFSGT